MIRSFKNPEEAIRHIRTTARGFRRLPISDWQAEMLVGDYFVQLVGDKLDIPCDIYGEVIESEYAEDRAMLSQRPELRLCRCYSPLCVEGEIGTIFIATMSVKLSREQFDKAKTAGWPPWGTI